MAILDIFSRRQMRERGEFPDVYKYDDLPEKLRNQLVHIFQDAFGRKMRHDIKYDNVKAFDTIVQILLKEYGLLRLTEEVPAHSPQYFFNWFLQEDEVERCLDGVELCCKIIDSAIRENIDDWKPEPLISPDEALQDINQRFIEAGVGYQYESGQIIRIDNQAVHKEVILPALQMLSKKMYSGANAEFLNAHDHYRKGNYPECLADCLKAFESTMKVICDKRKWKYDQKDTASKLIEIVLDNGLIPEFLKGQFTALQGLLKSGIPTIRNRQGGHGQGAQPNSPPEYMASYQLHQTAATILMLAKAEEKLP